MPNKSKPAPCGQPSAETLHTDLSLALGERGLLIATLDAVQSLDPRAIAALETPSPSLRPQMLLTLVTYCYATSLYGSRDIETASAADGTVRYICARTRPSWASIRSFRRRNRDAIRACLTQVLKQCWAARLDRGDVEFLGYDWFENQMAPRFSETAEQRIETAVLFDSTASE